MPSSGDAKPPIVPMTSVTLPVARLNWNWNVLGCTDEKLCTPFQVT